MGHCGTKSHHLLQLNRAQIQRHITGGHRSGADTGLLHRRHRRILAWQSGKIATALARLQIASAFESLVRLQNRRNTDTKLAAQHTYSGQTLTFLVNPVIDQLLDLVGQLCIQNCHLCSPYPVRPKPLRTCCRVPFWIKVLPQNARPARGTPHRPRKTAHWSSTDTA